MSTTNNEERLLDANFENFATSPQVTIRVGSASHEYKLSKALLCKQSPYFAATFEGTFKEGEEQSTTLEEIDGVVSPRSFQMLVQWVYLGRIVFGESSPEDTITAAIEFGRLADMCGVTGVESLIAEHVKAIIVANPPPLSWEFEWGRAPDSNTHCITSQHIISAIHLSAEHPIRRILAAAAVEGYLRKGDYKFLRETSEVPEFSVDLLKEVRATLTNIIFDGNRAKFTDPISGKILSLLD